MRTISTTVNGKVSQAATQPGYLLEIPFSYFLRYSSRGSVTWNGGVFISADFDVSGISWDGTANQSGTLAFTNLDGSLIALILGEGVAGRKVKIWKFYEGAVASDDPVAMFDGAADEATIEPDTGQVSITLVGDSISSLSSPRRFIGKPDFNFLPANGAVLVLGSQRFVLQSERSISTKQRL